MLIWNYIMKGLLPIYGKYRRQRLCAVLLLLLTLSFVAQGKKTASEKEHFASKQVLAVINGEELTYEQYDDATRLAEFRYDYLSARRVLEIKQDFFTHLLEQRLLVQEAGRREIFALPEEMTDRLKADRGSMNELEFRSLLNDLGLFYDNYCRMVYEDLVIKKLLTDALPRHIKVREQEIDDYYFSHLGDFARRDLVHALHIFLSSRREARVVMVGLRYGADFQELARRKSTGREAALGGELGYFQRSDMPVVFFDSCWSLPLGDMSKVIKSAHGYHIFKLLDKVEGRMLTKKEARKDIVAVLRNEKREKFYGDFLRQLSDGAEIELSEKVMFVRELRQGEAAAGGQ